MKKIVLSLVVIVGMSSLGFAAENTESEKDKGFYAGIAYSHLSQDIDYQDLTTNVELDFNAVMFQVGYKFNPYIAVEARYNVSLGDTDVDDLLDSAEVSVLSLFAKPMYPIAPEMDIYVLLGYSMVDASNSNNATSFDESAFSWGAGAAYSLTEEMAVFVEYTQFYNDTFNGFDHVVDSFNVGVSYQF